MCSMVNRHMFKLLIPAYTLPEDYETWLKNYIQVCMVIKIDLIGQ